MKYFTGNFVSVETVCLCMCVGRKIFSPSCALNILTAFRIMLKWFLALGGANHCHNLPWIRLGESSKEEHPFAYAAISLEDWLLLSFHPKNVKQKIIQGHIYATRVAFQHCRLGEEVSTNSVSLFVSKGEKKTRMRGSSTLRLAMWRWGTGSCSQDPCPCWGGPPGKHPPGSRFSAQPSAGAPFWKASSGDGADLFV